MICKRCGLEVEAELVEQGVLNNRYKCPKCAQEFGGKTLLNKGLRVAGFLVTLGVLGSSGTDDINLDS